MPINPRNRQRELAIQIRLQAGFERGLARRLISEFNRAARAAEEGYKDAGRMGVLINLADHQQRLEAVLAGNMFDAGEAMGRRVINMVAAFRKDEESIFEQVLRAFVGEHALERSTLVGDTTIKMARETIDKGQIDGLGANSIAALLRKALGGVIGVARARTIARTEIHTAANVASRDAVVATGVNGLMREWLSAEDDRTRQTHNEADGQIVGMNEKFSVGAAKLLIPGDPTGPAKEVINCRCGVGYITPDLG